MKDKSWASTGDGQKTSWTEIPNVLFFFTLLFSQLVALIRFLPCGNHSIAEVCNYYEPSFRSFATVTYSIANQAAEPVETPNIHPQVHDIGQCMFYVLYFGTTATGVVWLYHLTTMYRSSTFATTAWPTLPCDTHVAS